MHLAEVSYTPQQLALFDQIDEAGVVLETVIMLPGKQAEDIYACSKAAAIKGMEILARRYALKANHVLHAEDVFRIQILPGKEPAGTKISFARFMGNGFDWSTNIPQLTAPPPGENNGFVYAFLYPPYGLRTAKDSSPVTALPGRLLKDFLETIPGVRDMKDTGHLEIYRWTDNWCNYFDDGKEWWGTFCWTIYNTENHTITFMAAAATD